MTILDGPKQKPSGRLSIVKDEVIEGATCTFCGAPAKVRRTVPVTYKVQVSVTQTTSYWGKNSEEAKKYPDIVYRVWLRASTGGGSLDGEWVLDDAKEAADLCMDLRDEYRAFEPSFVLGLGPNSGMASTKEQFQKVLVEQAQKVRTHIEKEKREP
jgi:hypothetical protein